MSNISAVLKTTTPIAVSPAEGAKMAGLGRTKLYEAISSGELPSFRIGTRRLIRVSAIEAWLASHESATAKK
ncbi:helix-turn-helix domain-containing protein [Hirschia baltica]|uniref:DNA binding domain protein, excisionase family n=1 Tax=Hirschia baltica (strain ATCC 49814 / DSM 5838 / IFAM 1418) TaxID=582402 RepID=C6XJN2_HIRBI|nr:helix-turn-helix domain-containing protein [Hirschia baltica]ACT59327.1 DNA binding domain protein, excisionase family [Hirschia baltica ATCC 49814]